MSATYSRSTRFDGCTVVYESPDGAATICTPWGSVTIAKDGRVSRMESWRLVNEAARALGWRTTFGGPATYGDTQYYWDSDVPTRTVHAPYTVRP